MNKKTLAWMFGLLVEAVGVLAYHGTGRGAPSTAGGTELQGWSLFLIFAVIGLLLYLGWRWWKKINESAFR